VWESQSQRLLFLNFCHFSTLRARIL
jgi:hypothetical protein